MAKNIKGKVKQIWESKLKQKPSQNKHISYSQLSSFATCQRQWYWTYVKKLAPYQPSIHTVFGTSMHEVIQKWLEIIYRESAKAADELDLDKMLYEEMIKNYKIQKAQGGHEHFSNQDELNMFYLDGKHILEFLKKKRKSYFTSRTMELAGIETLLYQELRPGVMFKGFIDLVFYNKNADTWTIMDIKTSTSGWRDEAKKDDKRISQILLYKEFFSKQFDIDIDKIEVEYFILKRKVPKDAEFASMQKRVQTFIPPSGKIKRGKAVSLMNNFVETAVDQNGEYIDKEYPTNPSKWNCNFCAFRNMKICKDAVN